MQHPARINLAIAQVCTLISAGARCSPILQNSPLLEAIIMQQGKKKKTHDLPGFMQYLSTLVVQLTTVEEIVLEAGSLEILSTLP